MTGRVGTRSAGIPRARSEAGEKPPEALERDAQRASVRTALDHLTGRRPDGEEERRAPRGGLLSFTGPAGSGKTTLLAEVRRLAADGRECTTLWARGGENEQSSAFHVLRQLFQPLMASYSEADRRAVLGDWYGIVGPVLGLCPAAEAAAPDPQGVRDGLDWVVTNVAVSRGALVLVLDDAHWADAESLTWLASFTARIEELPVLAIVAYRPDEVPDIPRAFGEMLSRRVRPMELPPLSAAAVTDLVARELGTDVEEKFGAEVWKITGGNPFETVGLSAAIRERGITPTGDNATQLHGVAGAMSGVGVLDRLDRLGSSVTRLAWAVAVLGTEASAGLAACVAGLGPAEAGQALDELRAAHIVRGEETLEFDHPLIATAVYGAIPAAVRVALHGKTAWELIESGKGSAAAARHLLETHPEEDDWVAGHLQEAAREYLRTGAPDAARRCLDRALREPPPPEMKASVLYELGSPALLRDPVVAINHLRAALDEPSLDPEMRVGAVIRLARSLAHFDQVPEAAKVLAEEARATTDPRVKLRMHTEHFLRAVFTTKEDDGPARSRLLAQLAQRLTGRDLTERYALGLRAWDAVVRGEPAAVALEHAERALGSGLSWTDEHWGYEIPALLALTFMYCDRPDRAEELFAEGIAEFEGKAWRGAHLSFGYTLLAYFRFRCGRLTDAEDFARAGLRAADPVGPRTPAQWYALGTLIEILLARGQVEAAQELAARYEFAAPFPTAVTIPNAQAVVGELLLAQGDHEGAARELEAVGESLDARGMLNPAWCPWQLHLALTHRSTDTARARELANEAVSRAERFGTDSAMGQALYVAARVHAEPERTELLQRAVGHLEKSPSTYELACALVDLGAALRRTGRLTQAAENLYRGLEVATTCGADAVMAKARTELAEAGLRPRRL
ncbi:ATP-binding protein [Streptomyces sp. NPDC053048]|uniref:ATP-binding protein n=1 Tax=Streptomyces sp. NPDC053048 TaxID=3365694 RepID=UPI0037D7D470